MTEAAMAGFLARFHEILDGLDELTEGEEMEELNAQFEDALFLMESIDPEDADAAEELEGALEELRDLPAAYRALAQEDPQLDQKLLELEMALKMAAQNLD